MTAPTAKNKLPRRSERPVPKYRTSGAGPVHGLPILFTSVDLQLPLVAGRVTRCRSVSYGLISNAKVHHHQLLNPSSTFHITEHFRASG